MFLWRRPEFFITRRALLLSLSPVGSFLSITILLRLDWRIVLVASFFFVFFVHFFILRFIGGGGGGAVLSTCAAQCVILG